MTVYIIEDDAKVPICLEGMNPDTDWIVFSKEDAETIEKRIEEEKDNE